MWTILPAHDAQVFLVAGASSYARRACVELRPRPSRCTFCASGGMRRASRPPFWGLAAPRRRFCSTAHFRHRVLFFGTDEFAVASLNALLKERDAGGAVKYLEVITPPDGPPRRPKATFVAPVKKFALENNLIVQHPPPKSLRDWSVPAPADSAVPDFDVAIAVSFGYFLPRAVLSAFKAGTLNVHPSLLPKYRGGSPIHHAVMNNDAKTGISVIDLHPQRFDAGRILKQVTVPIEGKPFLAPLYKKLAIMGGEMLVHVLKDLPTYQAQAVAQDETLATSANKINRTYAEADFAKFTAEQLYARHRALSNQFSLTAHLPKEKNTLVRLTEVEDPETAKPSQTLPADAAPGTFTFDPVRSTLFVCCADGAHLPVRRLHVVGKPNAVEAEEWFRGYGDRWDRFVPPPVIAW